MKILALSLLLIAPLLSAPSLSRDVQQYGVTATESCGTVMSIRERAEKDPLYEMVYLRYMEWVFGYLSGVQEVVALNSTDNVAIMVWINNYCQANPLNDIGTAAQKLLIELISE